VDAAVDRRAAQREQTRQALVEAALSLFAAKGYDDTSVDEIAAWAGVSPRTFFRHFETKERVLFFGGEAFNAAVLRTLPGRPVRLGDLAALEATMIALAPTLTPLKARIRLYFRALETSTALLGRHVALQSAHYDEVASVLAARRGAAVPDVRAQLAAAVAAATMDRTYRVWFAGRRALPELVAEHFALVRELTGADPRRR
jgi:AcrR family transcriptional regulator